MTRRSGKSLPPLAKSHNLGLTSVLEPDAAETSPVLRGRGQMQTGTYSQDWHFWWPALAFINEAPD